MRRSLAAALGVAFATSFLTVPTASAETPPLRLRGGGTTLEGYREPGSDRVWLSPSVLVQADGEPFELRVRRPALDQPLQTDWVRSSGTVALPDGLIRGWRGAAMYGFFHVTIADRAGRVFTSVRRSFCPAGSDRYPATREASDEAVYPDTGCYGNPFTAGQVWGIEQGWIASPWLSLRPSLPKGHRYTLSISVTQPWRDALGLAEQTVSYPLRLAEPQWWGGPGGPRVIEDAPSEAPQPPDAFTDAPDPATLPDLRSLPAWNIGLRKEFGRTLLAFNATVWNAGPAPLVVDGFRDDGEEAMRAYQGFFRDGQRVGSAEAGSMTFHTDPTHNHWHFNDFAEYRLLSDGGAQVLLSGKQSFCLAPTDAQDLTLPGAQWRVGSLGFSRCGGPEAVSIREALPAGWGDTYYQGMAGQAFDVTDLPNGFYEIEVAANPSGNLLEGDTTNGSSRRTVALGGAPGRRTLVVAPVSGIRF